MKRPALLVLLLVVAFNVFSLDFGLLVNQTLEAENELLTYTPAFTPWFSWNSGNGLSVYLSGLLSLQCTNDYAGTNGFLFIPELYRFSVLWRIKREMSLEAGRIPYTDAMGFATYGLFDGLKFTMLTPYGGINAGVYYSGLLYKETAKITMTENDRASLSAPWGSDSSADYFASRRLLAALRWDMPIGETMNLSAEFLVQFDLNSGGGRLRSQYGEVQYEYYPMSIVKITAAALFETMQNDSGDFGAAFGAMAQAQADLPGFLNDRLGFSVKFTSGPASDAFGYSPINSITQSAVLPDIFAGLCVISADYDVRILNTLYAEGALRCFIRAYEDPFVSGVLYGGELWASIVWQPLEDIRATLGAGAFFPGLGNINLSGTGPLWKISAAVTLSL